MTEFRTIENFDDFVVGRLYYWREIQTGKLGMFTHYEGHKPFERFEWGAMVPNADELNEMMNNMHDALEHLETMCGVVDECDEALKKFQQMDADADEGPLKKGQWKDLQDSVSNSIKSIQTSKEIVNNGI